MTTGILPVAPEQYDRSNEQRTRTDIDLRLSDIETKLYQLQTIYGTVALGEGNLTLANGANSNVAPGYTTYIRIIGPSAAFSTTGFSGGDKGRLMIVRNTVAFDWTISNESGSSDAANRIITSTGADVTLTGVSVGVFVYDATDSRWILIATQG
jgi:hypothetical protein